jgi:hypothetical protein
MKMKKSRAIFKLIAPIVLAGLLFTPIGCFAAGDAGVIVAIHLLGHMLQTYMLQELHQFSHEQTTNLTDKEEDIFKQKTHWEQWPASLREMIVEQSVKLENKGNQVSYKNAMDYLSYSQGSASGVDATKYPAKATHSFNKDYDKVQSMNPSCKIDVPQPIGDGDNQCSPAQQQFTNYLLTGVHPIPDYPNDSTNTSDGQAYIQAKHVSEARAALSQVALDQASNAQTNQFIQYMQKNLKNPSIDQINKESMAAVSRDTLIMEKARAIIALKQYETTLMNERLLATMVAQNEGAHLQRIRELSQNIH